jgi:hypothetical protein
MARLAQLGLGAFLLCDVAGLAIAAAVPRFEVTPRLAVVYDSNIAKSSEELAKLRGLKRQDVRLSPGVGFSAALPLGNQELFVNSDVSYDFHQRNERLNRERILGQAGARLRYSRCSGTVTGTLSRRQSDIADLLDVGDVKNTETFSRIALDGRCGGPVGISPLFGIGRSAGSNSNDLRQYADYTSVDGKLGVAYARPSFGELSLLAQVRDLDYKDRPSSLFGDVSDGYKTLSLGGRYERRIGSRLQGGVGLFRTTVDPKGPGEKFTGLTADADLTAIVSQRLRAQFNAVRDIQPAGLGAGDYTINSAYGASLDYTVSPKLSLTAGGGYVRRSTRGEVISPVAVLGSENRYSSYARATYRRSERTSADVELRREVREADPDLFDYASTRATLNLRLVL